MALSKGLKIQHLGEFDFVYSQATPEAATTLVPAAQDVETQQFELFCIIATHISQVEPR